MTNRDLGQMDSTGWSVSVSLLDAQEVALILGISPVEITGARQYRIP
jgi:hypothetical protein